MSFRGLVTTLRRAIVLAAIAAVPPALFPAAGYAVSMSPPAAGAPPSEAGEGVKAPVVEAGEANEIVEAEADVEEGEEGERRFAGAGGGANTAGGAGGFKEGPAASAAEAAGRVRISSLRLLRTTVTALAHRAVRASQVRFAFTLSAPARVRVRLARASNRAGEVRWRALPDSVTLAAARGVDRARLHAANVLGAGEYRLTLIAYHGNSRSIIIRVS
jgi:hypothetical protein